MRTQPIYVKEVSSNGYRGYTDDYDTICYNIINVKGEDFLDSLHANIGKTNRLTEVFGAGRFISVLSAGLDRKWQIEFFDLGNNEEKAINTAVNYDVEISRRFMSVFNNLNDSYERHYAQFALTIGDFR